EGFRLANDPAVKNVVIGASWHWYLRNSDYYLLKDGRKLPIALEEGALGAQARLAAKIKELRASGKKVFLLLGTLIDSRNDPARFADRLQLVGGVNGSARFPMSAGALALRDGLLDFAKRNGAIAVDPLAVVCPGGICKVIEEGGMAIYRDPTHFN